MAEGADLPYNVPVITPKSDLRGPFPTLAAYLELVRLPNLFTSMADVLMGFLFPLLGRLFMERGDRGEEVGALYTVNTLGAVAGSVGVTIVLIPVLGASNGYLLLTGFALVSFAIYLRLAGDRLRGRPTRRGRPCVRTTGPPSASLAR